MTKINKQKSVTLLYNNEKPKEIKKNIPFIIASKRMKHSGVNLTKEAKDLKTYKPPLKEIKDNTNKCKDIPRSWIRIFNIVKMSILPQII